MKYAIITGASKGLGASLAQRLLKENVGIVTVSRTVNNELEKWAKEKKLFFKHFSCDLADMNEVETVFMNICELVLAEEAEELYLFNNAGVIEPIDTVGNLAKEKVMLNIQVNLVAPTVITNLLLNKVKGNKLTVINVTSGAGERPIQGWSTYCSTKAALNMFTKTTALEQKTANSGHVIIGYSPGIMDTEMQGTIRSSTAQSFHDVETFKEYKEKGMLRSTDVVADALIDLLLAHKAENGMIYNVNELLG